MSIATSTPAPSLAPPSSGAFQQTARRTSLVFGGNLASTALGFVSNILIMRALGPEGNPEGMKVIARSLYKELRANGCGADEVLAICTEMLDEVTSELKASDVMDAAGETADAA